MANLVSVVLPVYKDEDYLEDALDSIADQGYESDTEVIIVHYTKSGKRPDVLEKFEGLEIRYQRQEEKGYSAAVNQGLKAAEGEFICFQDADDISCSNRFEKQIDVLESNSDVAVVYSSAIFLDDSDEPFEEWGGYKSGKIKSEEIFYRLYIEGSFIANPSVMMRHSMIKGILFDEDLPAGSDWDFYLRIAHNHAFYELKNPVIKMRRGKEHEHMGKDQESFLYNLRRLIKKNRRRFKDTKNPLSRRDYMKAMGNHLLEEASYYFGKDLLKSLWLSIYSLCYYPTNPNIVQKTKILLNRVV